MNRSRTHISCRILRLASILWLFSPVEPYFLGTILSAGRFRKNGSRSNAHRTLGHLFNCFRCFDPAGVHVSRCNGYSVSKWEENSRRETSLKSEDFFGTPCSFLDGS